MAEWSVDWFTLIWTPWKHFLECLTCCVLIPRSQRWLIFGIWVYFNNQNTDLIWVGWSSMVNSEKFFLCFFKPPPEDIAHSWDLPLTSGSKCSAWGAFLHLTFKTLKVPGLKGRGLCPEETLEKEKAAGKILGQPRASAQKTGTGQGITSQTPQSTREASQGVCQRLVGSWVRDSGTCEWAAFTDVPWEELWHAPGKQNM